MDQTSPPGPKDTGTEQLEMAPVPTGLPAATEVQTTDLESRYSTKITTYLVLASMGLTWGTCTLANVGPSSTYSNAVAEIGGSSISSWVPNAALFPLIGLQPLWGGLSDRFGKKWFIVAGGIAGLVGNIVAATAHKLEVVIVGQALSGTGASLFLLVIPAGMEIVTAKNRSFAQGALGFLNGIMAIVGIISAGYFAQSGVSGWRWVYYFNAIFFGVCGLLIAVLYHPPPTKLRREYTAVAEIRSLDYAGLVLLMIGVIGIVISLTWGGNQYAWSDSRVISLLVIGCAFLVGFGIYEAYGRNDGLLDHRFFENRNFILVLSVAFVDGMLLYGVNAFFPVETSAVFTDNVAKANEYLLPLNILVLVGIIGSSAVLGLIGRYRMILIISVFLVSLFCGLLALVTPSRLAMALVFCGFIGLGVGVTTVIPVVVLTYAVPSHLLGTAGTILASTRALGGTAGITIFASIYSNQMAKNLPGGVASAAVAAGLPQSSVETFVQAFLGSNSSAVEAVSGVTPDILADAAYAVKSVSAYSFRYVWIANMAFGVVAGILCCFLLPVKDSMTHHVESALEQGQLRNKQQEYYHN